MAPEFRRRCYDGCQATVWASEMILVENLSPYKAFSGPEQAHKRPTKIPEHLSPGNFINLFYLRIARTKKLWTMSSYDTLNNYDDDDNRTQQQLRSKNN